MEQANSELTPEIIKMMDNSNPLLDYIIVFDDEDKNEKGRLKRINKKSDRYDAIMEFVGELEESGRSAYIRKAYTLQ